MTNKEDIELTYLDYDFTLENLLEQSIKFKFNNIKNLEINTVAGMTNISFSDTGEYSKNEVEEYLKQLIQECKKI